VRTSTEIPFQAFGTQSDMRLYFLRVHILFIGKFLIYRNLKYSYTKTLCKIVQYFRIIALGLSPTHSTLRDVIGLLPIL